MGKDSIKEQLLAVGWTEEEFDKAYAEALVVIGVPVPAVGRGAYNRASTGDVTLSLFSFILLGIVVAALINLYFSVINVFLPDKLSSYSSYYYTSVSSTIHYAIAALVVALPLYYLAVRYWFKRFNDDEARTESKLTKWLTYLVLLIASVTVVVDLIVVLFQFLQGEITSRFILKAIVVLVITGMIFGFYFLERKKIQYQSQIPRKVFQSFGYALIGLAILGVGLGFMASGGPDTERDRRFDGQRSGDLSSILACVTNYTEAMKELPVSLSDLESYEYSVECALMVDPETETPYEYRILSPVAVQPAGALSGSIEICANFALSTDEDRTVSKPVYEDVYMPRISNDFYEHEAGRSCFTRSIVVKMQPSQSLEQVMPAPTI